MLVQSFVPPAETRFRADIVRLFKRENFVNSAINTAAGVGPGPSAGLIGAPGGATRAGMVSATGGSVPALYTQATSSASSSFPRYIGPAMGPGRVSSGVNWVNSYPSQPAYPTTMHGGTSAGSASSAPAVGAASATSVAKPSAHVQNALDDVIDQESVDEVQSEAVVVAKSGSSRPSKNAKDSNSAEDNASVHSDSDSDSNADEEEEQEEPEEGEGSGEEIGKQKGRGGNRVDFGVGAVNAPGRASV